MTPIHSNHSSIPTGTLAQSWWDPCVRFAWHPTGRRADVQLRIIWSSRAVAQRMGQEDEHRSGLQRMQRLCGVNEWMDRRCRVLRSKVIIVSNPLTITYPLNLNDPLYQSPLPSTILQILSLLHYPNFHFLCCIGGCWGNVWEPHF